MYYNCRHCDRSLAGCEGCLHAQGYCSHTCREQDNIQRRGFNALYQSDQRVQVYWEDWASRRKQPAPYR